MSKTSSREHVPVEVVANDGIPFVKCSCDDGRKWQSAYWLREHWQGTEAEGVAALESLVARQSER